MSSVLKRCRAAFLRVEQLMEWSHAELVSEAKWNGQPHAHKTKEDLALAIAMGEGLDVDSLSTRKQRRYLETLAANLDEEVDDISKFVRLSASEKIDELSRKKNDKRAAAAGEEDAEEDAAEEPGRRGRRGNK